MKCVVCDKNKSNVVFQCTHCCMCANCYLFSLRSYNKLLKCPICNTNVRIYTFKNIIHNKYPDSNLQSIDTLPQSNTIFQEDECCICLNAQSDIVLYPCKHKIQCFNCWTQSIDMKSTNQLKTLKCSYCRADVQYAMYQNSILNYCYMCDQYKKSRFQSKCGHIMLCELCDIDNLLKLCDDKIKSQIVNFLVCPKCQYIINV